MGDGDVAVKRGHTAGFGYYEEDVIAEILARLPVKSLMRFRCVCKSWRGLISESYFVKKHLSYGERVITESPRRLIFNLDPHPLALDCNALKTVEDYEALEPIKSDDVHGDQFAITPLDFPVKKTGCEIVYRILVGACNGLLCVEVNYEDIILWNHCTRDFTVLPYPPLINSKFSSYLYGFGYDSANDDYKVIWGLSCYSNGADQEITIHIFSLKTCSWRTVKDIEYVGLSLLRGLFVNGALHWLYHLSVGGGSSRILSFDLGEEEFQKTISLPYDGLFSEPFIHRNCLCVGNYFPTEAKSINIWMMKEYGVKESWTQVLQFSLENHVLDGFTYYFRTVCILENGLVLINSMRNFEQLEVFSNFKEKTFTHFVEVAAEDYFDTIIYRETLVPARLPHIQNQH